MADPNTLLQGVPLLIWPAVVAFVTGGIANATGRPKIRASFINLGFPGWWCRVTAVVEIAAALLLLISATRLVGVALGGCTMAVAIAAIVARRLYAHLPPPVLFLLLLALAGLGRAA